MAVMIAVAGLSGCGSHGPASANGVTTLRYQGWTDEITDAELAQDLGFFGGKIKLDWVGNTISGPQDIQSAATGQTDFGGAFAGAVAKLAAAGAPITAVINYYGTDSLSFTGFYDALKKAGLTLAQIKSVQLVTLPPPNIEDSLRKGQIDVGELGGQFRLRGVAAGGIRPVFTDLDLYGPYNGGQYVLRNDLIAQHPDAVRAFTTGIAKALEWERNTPRDQVIAEFTKIINARHRPNEDTSTLQYWQSVGVPTQYGKISDEDFTRWQSWLEDTGAIHGPLNPSKLYTNKFNALVTGGKGT
jgi:ABC-type nitrate/sulfonate/bicarbonate transport system substrate-binding protein